MQRKLDISLRRFTPSKVGGMDLISKKEKIWIIKFAKNAEVKMLSQDKLIQVWVLFSRRIIK